jgi:hypothetical protein
VSSQGPQGGRSTLRLIINPIARPELVEGRTVPGCGPGVVRSYFAPGRLRPFRAFRPGDAGPLRTGRGRSGLAARAGTSRVPPSRRAGINRDQATGGGEIVRSVRKMGANTLQVIINRIVRPELVEGRTVPGRGLGVVRRRAGRALTGLPAVHPALLRTPQFGSRLEAVRLFGVPSFGVPPLGGSDRLKPGLRTRSGPAEVGTPNHIRRGRKVKLRTRAGDTRASRTVLR